METVSFQFLGAPIVFVIYMECIELGTYELLFRFFCHQFRHDLFSPPRKIGKTVLLFMSCEMKNK